MKRIVFLIILIQQALILGLYLLVPAGTDMALALVCAAAFLAAALVLLFFAEKRKWSTAYLCMLPLTCGAFSLAMAALGSAVPEAREPLKLALASGCTLAGALALGLWSGVEGRRLRRAGAVVLALATLACGLFVPMALVLAPAALSASLLFYRRGADAPNLLRMLACSPLLALVLVGLGALCIAFDGDGLDDILEGAADIFGEVVAFPFGSRKKKEE